MRNIEIESNNIMRIYENARHKSYDILISDILEYTDGFYDEVLSEQIKFEHGFTLCEEFKLISKDQPIKQGVQDTYEVKQNGFTFTSTISYYKNKELVEQISKHITEAEYKHNINTSKELSDLKNIMEKNPNNYIAVIYFKDIDSNTTLTGKVGHYSYAVISAIKQSFFDSIIKSKKINNLSILMIMVSKEEPKRVKLYSKLVSKNLTEFNKEIIDSNSNAYNYIIYRFKG